MKKERKYWLRKLSCGHSRPTNLAFMVKDYTKPKVGEECYCRSCCNQAKIVGVEEITC